MFRLVFIAALVGVVYARQISQFDRRIVGGKDTRIEDHPYQLSLQFQNRHRCGASLIRSNVAVTAAHCTEDVGGLEARLTVRAGSSLLHQGGQVAKVLKICDHPKYNTDLLDYDVSVLLLNQSFTLGPAVQTVPLQPVNAEVPTGTTATVTGWGMLINGGTLSQKLQEVQVPNIEYCVCVDLYSKTATVTDRMICFGFIQGGKDTCQGDSGGPLIVNGKLVGIISWGFGCAAPERPGVYTKVSHPEVNSHVNKCVGGFL